MNRLSVVCGLFGAAFGFLFVAAGLNQYDVIHRMLLLENVAPFLIMGSAMGTALPLLWLLERRRWRTPLGGDLVLRRWSVEPKHVWGAAIFGTGWAITGACPGTASTALGAGGLLGIVLIGGIVAGIALRDAVSERQAASTPEPLPEPASP